MNLGRPKVLGPWRGSGDRREQETRVETGAVKTWSVRPNERWGLDGKWLSREVPNKRV